MDAHDRATLERMLTEMMSAQDDLTHTNETHRPLFARAYREIRNGARDRILEFVEAIVNEAGEVRHDGS